MAKPAEYDTHEDQGWFRDELRRRDEQIAELRSELDEANDLVQRLRENAEDYTACIESWCETFGMELTDKGWKWQPFWEEYAQLRERHHDLIKRWNKAVAGAVSEAS